MRTENIIQVWEHDVLEVGGSFRPQHFAALKSYLTNYPDCGFFALLDNAVRFNQYVGAIQVGELTIEVLPKTDRHKADEGIWQEVLIEMIFISQRVPVSVSTQANMFTHRRRVLDAYFQMFLTEVENLMHEGLTKKYRRQESNQTALRGRLLFQQQVRRNVVHKERFYVAHSTYDRDNVYNSVLLQALHVMESLRLPSIISGQVADLLLHFPECQPVVVSDKLFKRLPYDRKTVRYQRAISIAEIILRHFHPDVRSGQQPILAVMFDMNKLWEAYIFDALSEALNNYPGASIEEKPGADFYDSDFTGGYSLQPDIVLSIPGAGRVVLDTKWKYNQRTSIHDLRQMYAYGHYFNASKSFLLYPFCNPSNPVIEKNGFFEKNQHIEHKSQSCGLLFVDLIKGKELNRNIGDDILRLWLGPVRRGDSE